MRLNPPSSLTQQIGQSRECLAPGDRRSCRDGATGTPPPSGWPTRPATGRSASCTLVFDPIHRKRPPAGTHDVHILISRRHGRNAADRTILDVARKSPEPGSICVYTSDKGLANALKPLGVTVRSAGSFRCKLDEATNPFQ